MTRRKKWWSYITGRKGVNRVRAFDSVRGLQLEFDDGEVSRRRMKLPECDQTKERAMQRADELAAKLGRMERAVSGPVSLEQLIDDYHQEVTPTKGASQQRLDDLSRRLWRAYLGPKGLRRNPATLDLKDWHGFIEARRRGLIQGYPNPVRERQVQIPMSWMICVLTWGSGAKNAAGQVYLPHGSPWSLERRKSWGVKLPRERTPTRKGMPEDVRALLIEHAPTWQFRVALELEHETMRRNASIRELWWSDLDFRARTIRWRGEVDKRGKTIVAPMIGRTEALLRSVPDPGIGDTPVFPSATDPSKPTPESTWFTWLQRAKRAIRAEIDDADELEEMNRRMHRVGYHSEARSGIRRPEVRRLPLGVQEVLTGKHRTTILDVYDYVDAEEARAAFEESTGSANRLRNQSEGAG